MLCNSTNISLSLAIKLKLALYSEAALSWISYLSYNMYV